MNKSALKLFIIPAVFLAVFLIITIMVKTFDVAPIGPQGSIIGFSTINQATKELIGVNMGWYNAINIVGALAILTAGCFCVLGLIQFIKRKNLLAVDKEILFLGVIYILVVSFYILFEILAVNFRPILIDGELEPAYPSSHSMVVCSIMLTAIMVIDLYIKNKPLQIVAKATFLFIAVITVVGRMLSGAHWLTDIISGLILSFVFISLYYALLKVFCQKPQLKSDVSDNL